MILSDEQRECFIQWLDDEIKSDSLIVEQMQKIKVPGAVILDRQKKIDAYKIVLDTLQRTERQ